jgi:hypothetical protein
MQKGLAYEELQNCRQLSKNLVSSSNVIQGRENEVA